MVVNCQNADSRPRKVVRWRQPPSSCVWHVACIVLLRSGSIRCRASGRNRLAFSPLFVVSSFSTDGKIRPAVQLPPCASPPGWRTVHSPGVYRDVDCHVDFNEIQLAVTQRRCLVESLRRYAYALMVNAGMRAVSPSHEFHYHNDCKSPNARLQGRFGGQHSL